MAEEKVEVPERVYLSRFWQSYIEHNCQFGFEKKFEDDILYVRTDAPNTRQRAERAARRIWDSKMTQSESEVADIIAAEFEK